MTRSSAPGVPSGRSRSGWIAFSKSMGPADAEPSFVSLSPGLSADGGSPSGLPPFSSVDVDSRPMLSRAAQRDASAIVISVPRLRG